MLSSCSSRRARISSFTLRAIVRSGVSSTFFTICCVIVLAPCIGLPVNTSRTERAQDAGVVEAAVAVEVRVLGRQHRQHQHARDLLERHHRAALLEELGDHAPLAVDDAADLRRVVAS